MTPQQVWNYLNKHMTNEPLVEPEDGNYTSKQTKSSVVKPLRRESFEHLCKDFSDNLHFTQTMQDTLACILAINISTDLGGKMIWMYVVGPPSSGKTTLAEALAGTKDYCKAVSKFTGLFSGKKSKSKKDVSLLPQIQNKTLLVKDWTAVLSMPAPVLTNIYGEFRDVFDGKASVHYRNDEEREYDHINFSMIACVTDEIQAVNNSHLGERFLKIEILDADNTGKEQVSMALSRESDLIIDSIRNYGLKTYTVQGENLHIQKATKGYLMHLRKGLSKRTITVPTCSVATRKRIEALARLTGSLRTHVKRDKGEELSYRPRAELGSRLGQQLLKLALSLALVLQKDGVDSDVYRIVRKVAMDTAKGFGFDLVKVIANSKDGLNADQLEVYTGIPKTTAIRRLKDLQALGVIARYKKSNNSGVGGRKLHHYILSPMAEEIWFESFRRRHKQGHNHLVPVIQNGKPVRRRKRLTKPKRKPTPAFKQE